MGSVAAAIRLLSRVNRTLKFPRFTEVVYRQIFRVTGAHKKTGPRDARPGNHPIRCNRTPKVTGGSEWAASHRLATEADLTETERSAAGGRSLATLFGRLGFGFATLGVALSGLVSVASAVAARAMARVATVATVAAMAAMATTEAAMATMAATRTAAIIATTITRAATMAVPGRSLLFTTQEGDAGHGEEDRQAESKSTIHREVPPTKRYG